ncbi:hypothetical protein EDB95_0127 [Dinghuibacter silviterrae]|uniref:Uncharacterized protein n=2 Tax=Dinghuibacter silviterrae TaxID=1539049 RepID=A0A4R8DMB6_9BACT|nr:hypothetical protein EDB95_0127 [Dinghuibacter silviterrae]
MCVAWTRVGSFCVTECVLSDGHVATTHECHGCHKDKKKAEASACVDCPLCSLVTFQPFFHFTYLTLPDRIAYQVMPVSGLSDYFRQHWKPPAGLPFS